LKIKVDVEVFLRWISSITPNNQEDFAALEPACDSRNFMRLFLKKM
jgi:hypothetical protein